MKYKIGFVIVISFILLFVDSDIKKFYLENQVNEDLNTQIEEFNRVKEDVNFFADSLYGILIDNRVKTILKIKDENRKRELLKNLLFDKYQFLKKRGVNVFHFFTVDDRSLIRFHKLNKYGDYLGDIRKSLKIVKQTKKPVFGFEIGVYHNSFRNIFPIMDNGKLLGIVEISFCDSIFQKFWNEKYFVLLNNNSIKNSSLISSYTAFNNYFLNKDSLNNSYFLFFSSLTNRVFSNKIGTMFEKNGNYYLVSKIILKDITKKEIGKLVIIKTNNIVKNIIERYEFINYFIIISMIVLIFLIILFDKLEKERERSSIDPLTKALNRRGADLLIPKHIKSDIIGSLMMLDIDFFKKVNDTYGHDVGDMVLEEVSSIIRDNIRSTDIFVRFGGEEFLVYLPNANLKSAKSVAQNIRKAIEHHTFNKVGKVTMSIGVTEKKLFDTFETLQKRADDALYKAKELGRNRVQSK